MPSFETAASTTEGTAYQAVKAYSESLAQNIASCAQHLDDRHVHIQRQLSKIIAHLQDRKAWEVDIRQVGSLPLLNRYVDGEELSTGPAVQAESQQEQEQEVQATSVTFAHLESYPPVNCPMVSMYAPQAVLSFDTMQPDESIQQDLVGPAPKPRSEQEAQEDAAYSALLRDWTHLSDTSDAMDIDRPLGVEVVPDRASTMFAVMSAHRLVGQTLFDDNIFASQSFVQTVRGDRGFLTRFQKPVRFFWVVQNNAQSIEPIHPTFVALSVDDAERMMGKWAANFEARSAGICLCDALGRPVKQGTPGVTLDVFDSGPYARAVLQMKIISQAHHQHLLLTAEEQKLLQAWLAEGSQEMQQARSRLLQQGTI